MTPNLYESLYGSVVDINIFMLKTARGVDMDELKATFSTYDGVNSVITNEEELEDINEVVKNLYFIIFLMIASAALLAFVVLYNLNNINISERRRELATFKVLGFTNSELATYVYRENVILTALGIIVGTITGVILHRIVMITVETDMYMFGRELNFASIVLATLLTILFTVIINEVMRKKLQKIDMIESLKSVE
jgi:putative ABC transport system permease protein